MALGVIVGLGGAAAFMVGLHVSGVVPWLVTIGLAKLTLVAASGLMFGGAALQRLARRSEQRKLRDGALQGSD